MAPLDLAELAAEVARLRALQAGPAFENPALTALQPWCALLLPCKTLRASADGY